MNTLFKAFGFLSFFFFLFMFSGCGKDDGESGESTFTPEILPRVQYAAKYLSDIECLGASSDEVGNTINLNFAGLKNNHLYVRSVQYDTLYENDLSHWKTLMEWEDTEITAKEQKIYLGYGNYENITIDFIEPRLLYTNGGNFTARLKIAGGYLNLLIFKYQESIKRITTVGYIMDMMNWYQGGVLTSGSICCCYSEKGDTIYTSTSTLPSSSIISVSYEEGVGVSGTYIYRYNYKESKIVWSSEITSPYNEPSNSKYTYTLLDKSTNIWKYKVDITYYDGTKKDFMFTVNVDDGKVTYL